MPYVTAKQTKTLQAIELSLISAIYKMCISYNTYIKLDISCLPDK